MIALFENGSFNPSIGVEFNFSEKEEIYVIGSTEKIKEYAYGGMKNTHGVMVHKCSLGSMAKSINELMRTKHEIDELAELAERLSDIEMISTGECHSVLENLSEYYHVSDHCNIIKNYVIYSLYCSFMRHRKEYESDRSPTIKKKHKNAEMKYIPDFKADTEKLFLPFAEARKKGQFFINGDLFAHEKMSDYTVYRYRGNGKTRTLYAANNSYITLINFYSDLLANSGRYLDNCEICGKVIYRVGKNSALICKSPECKKKHSTQQSNRTRELSMQNPASATYSSWNNRCSGYKRQLLKYPDKLKLYMAELNAKRAYLQNEKEGLTAKSGKELIDEFTRKCDEAAAELEITAQNLKDEAENG